MTRLALALVALLTGCAQYEATMKGYDTVDNKVYNVKQIVSGAKDIKYRTKKVTGK